MFTGIVEERGRVVRFDGPRLVVGCRTVVQESPLGASVAVNGTCLTVVDREEDSLAFDVSEETSRRTSMARLAPGGAVNLERPVSLAARLGGHLVQGHVDGVARVISIDRGSDGDAWLRVRVPADLSRYVVEKGSIALDGVSLTVAEVEGDEVSIALIPHTLDVTTLGQTEVGQELNVEVDMVAKYVERLMEGRNR